MHIYIYTEEASTVINAPVHFNTFILLTHLVPLCVIAYVHAVLHVSMNTYFDICKHYFIWIPLWVMI